MKNRFYYLIEQLISKKLFLLLFGVLIIFFVSTTIGKSIIFKSNEINNLIKYLKVKHEIGDFFGNPIFWNLNIGITLKALIDILISSVLLYSILKLYNISINYAKTFKIIVVSQTVFIIKFWTEFAFLLTKENNQIGIALKDYTIFSLSSFLNILNIKYSSYYNYAFQVLNLFEVLYCFFLSLVLKIILKIKFQKAISIVCACYFLPLILWLLIISLLSVIFS
jgi:hypothetical protein